MTDDNPKRTAFLAMLHKIVDPVPPLDPRLMPESTVNGMVQQDFSIASTASWRVPGTIRRPANATGRLPVVIGLHETDSDRNSSNVVKIATALTNKGFMTVAISGRSFGQANGNNSGYINSLKAANANPGSDYPFLYDTVWDVLRLIDYLVTRADIDANRIGLFGISKGGMEAYLAAAVDPRIAVTAPIIGIQSFKWSLEHNAFQARANSLEGAVPNPNDAMSVRDFFSHVSPGLVDLYDCPDMMPLIAPRPLIVLSGIQDPRCPIQGVQMAIDATIPAYAQRNAADKFKFFKDNVAHVGSHPPFHNETIAWIEKWLASPSN